MISIKIVDDELNAAMRRLEEAVVDLSPAMIDIAQALAHETELNFSARGRPTWQPLAESTLLNRARARAGARGIHRKDGKGLLKSAIKRMAGAAIMQDTGRLASSITTDADSTHAIIGTNVEYAAIHQFGGMAGRGRKVAIPARPFLPVTAEGNLQSEANRDILDTVLRHLERAAGGGR